MTHTILFDPRSPLVLRTGRPFDQAGDPRSLTFPLPSSIAGACRTAYGDQSNVNFSDANARDALLQQTVHGPLAARINHDAVVPYVPRPADALYRDADPGKEMIPLTPASLGADEYADFPENMLPLTHDYGLEVDSAHGPDWWSIDVMNRWLRDPRDTPLDKSNTWHGPIGEHRTHTALDPETLSVRDGQLFQTQGMDFGARRLDGSASATWSPEQYGLLAHTPTLSINKPFQKIGGEGRGAFVHPLDDVWPTLDSDLEQALQQSTRIRLVLATPALFEHGFKPGWVDRGHPPGHPNITLKLCAAACRRWEPLSGWDIAANKARATRRLTPAGAVYWFKVVDGQQHVPNLWLNTISDREQDRRDGFGLVLPGIWK